MKTNIFLFIVLLFFFKSKKLFMVLPKMLWLWCCIMVVKFKSELSRTSMNLFKDAACYKKKCSPCLSSFSQNKNYAKYWYIVCQDGTIQWCHYIIWTHHGWKSKLSYWWVVKGVFSLFLVFPLAPKLIHCWWDYFCLIFPPNPSFCTISIVSDA